MDNEIVNALVVLLRRVMANRAKEGFDNKALDGGQVEFIEEWDGRLCLVANQEEVAAALAILRAPSP